MGPRPRIIERLELGKPGPHGGRQAAAGWSELGPCLAKDDERQPRTQLLSGWWRGREYPWEVRAVELDMREKRVLGSCRARLGIPSHDLALVEGDDVARAADDELLREGLHGAVPLDRDGDRDAGAKLPLRRRRDALGDSEPNPGHERVEAQDRVLGDERRRRHEMERVHHVARGVTQGAHLPTPGAASCRVPVRAGSAATVSATARVAAAVVIHPDSTPATGRRSAVLTMRTVPGSASVTWSR